MNNHVFSPEALRSLLHWQLEHRREMLLYTLLQSHCGLRSDEAYRILQAPHQYFIGTSHLFVPSILTKGTCGRKVALCPAFCAWLEMVPDWTDLQSDLRPRDRNGQPLSSRSLRAALARQIRQFDPQKCWRDVLRRGWLRACIAIGMALHGIAAEAGLFPYNDRRHPDSYWTKTMAEKWFGIFPEPGGPPSPPTDSNESDDSTGAAS
jgi:hypothetical protein